MLAPEFKWLINQARPLRRFHLVQISAVILVSGLNLLDPIILKWSQ